MCLATQTVQSQTAFFSAFAVILGIVTLAANYHDQLLASYRLVLALMFILRGFVLFQNHITMYLALF